MRRVLPAIIALTLFIPFIRVTQPASASAATPQPTYQGQALCLPDAYLQEPADCLPLGPSSRLTQLAKSGISVPAQPFPVKRLAAELAGVPYRYALASKASIPTYSSIDDAIARNVHRTMPAGRKYLSYSQRVENASGVFYLIQTGEWVSGEDIQSRVSASVVFNGVQITRIPRLSFGWVLDISESHTSPGYNTPKTGKKYYRFNMVWAYSIQSADGVDWVQVGENEWLEDRVVGRVTPRSEPPPGVTNGRWIEVNLAEQTLMVYDQSRLVFATLISSGSAPFYTRPGVFQIYKKLDAEQMSGTFEADHSDYYYLENVPWTMYFDEARAIHGVYWHTLFGYAASHGCVNLSLADAHWVYNWAQNGDTVYVWDPTGKTPTDIPSAGGP
jgi:hypothetical protein